MSDVSEGSWVNKMEDIINKLRNCEDLQLHNFRVEREKINGMQEGYQLAMEKAREIVQRYTKEDKS